MSAVFLTLEVSGRPGPSATERQRVEGIARGEITPGISIESQLDFLFDCRIAMTSITGRAQPSTVRMAILDNCLVHSLALANQSPSFSAAWHTSAVASAMSRDWPSFRAYTEKSYLTGRNEQWIAEMRVDLISDYIPQLDDELLAAHRADLMLLLSHDSGRNYLASRYVALDTFRHQIDQILPDVAEPDARRFLNIVGRLTTLKQRQQGGS